MTLTVWGLACAFIGALLIAGSTIWPKHHGVFYGGASPSLVALMLRRWPKVARWAERVSYMAGWGLLTAGFGLQLLGTVSSAN